MLEDVDNWTRWTDPTSKTHILSHKTLKREGNIVVWLEEEVAGGYMVRHTDRCTFYPKDRIVVEIIEGPMSGNCAVTLKDEPKEQSWTGLSILMPQSLRLRIIGALRGKKIMQGIADEYCRQLAEYSETIEGACIRKEQILP